MTQPPMHGYDVLFVQRFIGAKQCGVADGFYGHAFRQVDVLGARVLMVG